MGTLRLYQLDFTPQDNYFIENIENYLTDNPVNLRYTFKKLNYLKLGMNITIKLPLDQKYQIENTCNYAVIDQDDLHYYYFVVSANWIARKTIQLTLTLDTIQTFFPRLSFSDKTQIIRETQDRLIKLNDNTYIRNIDHYNEGLNPAKQIQKSKQSIQSDIGGKWYLTYMSNPATTQDSTGNPMFVGLLADVPYLIYPAVSNDDKAITISATDDATIIFITDSAVGDGASVTIGTATYTFGDVDGNTTLRAIKITKPTSSAAGSVAVERLYYTGDTYPYSYDHISGKASLPSGDIKLHNIRVYHRVNYSYYYSQLTSLDKFDSLATTVINAGTLPAVYTTSYNNFDNSNSKLSKIIELPYPPIYITKQSDGTYLFDNCTFHYGYKIMQFNGSRLSSYITQDTRLQDLLYITLNNPTAKDAPNIELESKLYSSEFYDYAYYYDSDKQPIRLEDISTTLLNTSINIAYNTTLTMNSDKQFVFSINNANYNEYQPYELYLNCARNTEKMILNDNYAEYIKNGYNYDQWNQKQQIKLARANAVISTVQAGFGLVTGVFGAANPIINSVKNYRSSKRELDSASSYKQGVLSAMNQSYSDYKNTNRTMPDDERFFWSQQQIESNKELSEAQDAYTKAKANIIPSVNGVGALVVNNGVSAINSTVNSLSSIESNKQQFINALNTRSNTPIAATGNTPVDLFDNYSSNKLIRYEYTMRDEDRNNVWKTFRLTGYSHPVQEKPIYNTRIYSNFIQCKPVFNNSSTEIYQVYLDDISLRLQAGVTVKHAYNGVYDLNDVYENYERFILED